MGGIVTSKQRTIDRTPSAMPARTYDFSRWDALPFVSCQCITYGRTELLDEAVESFLRQDYAGAQELVILNDYSELTIQCDLPEVKVVNLPYRMKTIGEKRNACVALCSGGVIFLWDDDDISLPHRISYSLQQMEGGRYFNGDKCWYWQNGVIDEQPVQNLLHGMSSWTVQLFDEVGGYPHQQSGEDAGLEELFKDTGRLVEETHRPSACVRRVIGRVRTGHGWAR
ncbi:MAG: glycosyltransferase [Planctomycetaceae bacterium]